MVNIEHVQPGAIFEMRVHLWSDDITSVAEWCSYMFLDDFAMTEFACRLIAGSALGGAANNRVAWDEGQSKNAPFESDNRYELQCSNKDLTLFLLKFKETK